MIKLVIATLALVSSVSFAQKQSVATTSIDQEMDSFGGNEALYDKASALNPEIRTQAIQNRFVERSNRFELAPEIGSVFGGDAYNQSNAFGMNAYYHLTPKWAFGLKYNYYTNKLTPEGQAMIDRASQDAINNPGNPSFLYPQVVFPKSETMASVSWYPIVGKLSFGSWGVAHFDTYVLAGYGTVELNKSSSAQTALGGGFGFWVTPHMTTRLEYRAQNYTAKYYDESRSMSVNTASIQVGWLL